MRKFLHFIFCTIFVFNSANVLAANYYEQENNNTLATAQPINLSFANNTAQSTVTGSLNSTSDNDFYIITVPANDTYVLNATIRDRANSSGSFTCDVVMDCFINGEALGTTFGSGIEDLAVITTSSSVVYAFKIKKAFLATTGTYAVDIKLERFDEDIYESNNSEDSTTKLTPVFFNDVATISTKGSNIHSVNDSDYYEFFLPTGYTYQIDKTTYSGGDKRDAETFTADIKTSYKIDNSILYTETFSAYGTGIYWDNGGTFIFRAISSSERIGRYEVVLTVKRTPNHSDSFEKNTTQETAYQLPLVFTGDSALINPALTNLHRFRWEIGDGIDYDYYKIVLDSGYNYNIVSNFFDHSDISTLTSEIYYFYSTDSVNWSDKQSSFRTTNFNINNGGIVFYKVIPEYAGTYSMKLKLKRSRLLNPDKYEDNSTEEKAALLSGDYSLSTLSISTDSANIDLENDIDYYKLELPEGFDYVIKPSLEGARDSFYNCPVKFAYRIQEAWGTTYASSSIAQNLINGGTIYYKIEQSNINYTGRYKATFDIVKTPNIPDPYETNNTEATAYSLALNFNDDHRDTVVTKGATIHVKDELDYYKIELPEGSDYQITPRFTYYFGYISFKIDNDPWGVEQNASYAITPIQIFNGGTLYIKVKGVDENKIGAYEVSTIIKRTVRIADKYEANNTEAVATELISVFNNKKSDINLDSLSIHVEGDLDYYMIDLPTGFNYTFAAVTENLSTSTKVSYKIDATGWKEFNYTSKIRTTKVNGGKVYLKCEATTANTTSTYKLSIHINRASDVPDIYENNDSLAVAYELPVIFTNDSARINTYGAVFHDADDKDFYKIVLPEGYAYCTKITFNDVFSVYENYAYTADGMFSYSVNNENFSAEKTDGSYTIRSVNGGDTICIKARPDKYPIGDYNISIQVLRWKILDDYEANDTEATAYTLPPLIFNNDVGVVSTESANLHLDGSVVNLDYFKIDLEDGYDYIVSAKFDTDFTENPYTIRAEASAKTSSSTTWPGASVWPSTVYPTNSSSVYYRISRYPYSVNIYGAYGTYKLIITVKRYKNTPDKYEDNNTEATATELPISFVNDTAKINTDGTYLTSGDLDYFKLNLGAGYSYKIKTSIDGVGNSTDYTGDAYYNYKVDNNDWSASAYYETPEINSFVNDAATFYLKASKKAYNGSYHMNITVIREALLLADAYEDNDTITSAYTLPISFIDDSARIITEANFHDADDIDYYKIDLAAGYDYVISSKWVDSKTDSTYTADIISKISIRYGFWYSPNNAGYDINLYGDNTLYIEIKPLMDGQCGTYQLVNTITRTLTSGDMYENNNLKTKAYEFNPKFINDTTTILTTGSTISNRNDNDYYYIPLPEGYNYTIEAEVLDNVSNPSIYGCNVKFDCRVDDYGVSSVSQKAPAFTSVPGGMLVNVYREGYSSLNLGSYLFKVHITRAIKIGDSYESNNSEETAYNCPINFINDSLVINTTGSDFTVSSDSDYYKISLPEGYIYKVKTRLIDKENSSAYSSNARLSYKINTANWVNTYDTTAITTIFYDGGTATYLVKPYSIYSYGTGSYNLELVITRELFTPDIYESNDSEESSFLIPYTPVGANTTDTIRIPYANIHRVSDMDYFKLDLPKGYDYNVNLIMHELDNDDNYTCDMSVSYRHEQDVDWDSRRDYNSLSRKWYNGGTLYYRFDATNAEGIGSYMLEFIITREPTEADIYENNNTEITAYSFPIVFDENYATVNTAGANLGHYSDIDYYKLELPAGYNYTIKTVMDDKTNSGGNYTADVYQYFKVGEGSTWSKGSLITVNGGGTVYFQVKEWDYSGTYLFTADIVRSAPDLYEDNNTEATATIVPVDFTSDLNYINRINLPGASIHTTTDIDYYKIIFPIGYDYSLSIRERDYSDEYTCDVKYSFKRNNGSWSSIHDGESSSTNLTNGGVLYIKIEGSEPTSEGTYDILVSGTRTLSVVDNYEANNTEATAYEFPVGFSGNNTIIETVGAIIRSETDQDYYKITLPEGGDYLISSFLFDTYNCVNTYSGDGKYSYRVNSGSWSNIFDSQASDIYVTGGEIVYFHVEPYSKDIGTYLLSINIKQTSFSADKYENNNTESTAYQLPISFTNNSATINTSGSNVHITSDVDYYKIVLPSGYDYTISSTLPDTDGAIEGLDGKIAYKINTSSWSTEYETQFNNTIVKDGGVIYIKVAPSYTGCIGNYLLTSTINRVDQESTTNVVNQPEANLFSLYPNPTNGNFYINLKNKLQGEISICIRSLNGVLLLSKQVDASQLKHLIKSNLSPGIYILEINNNDFRDIKRLIVK